MTTFNLALAPDGKCRSSNAMNLQNLVADGRLSMGITSTVEEELESGGSRGSVGQPAAPRRTYKSCEYCARRKRRCDGDGVNRCRSVLIDSSGGGSTVKSWCELQCGSTDRISGWYRVLQNSQ